MTTGAVVNIPNKTVGLVYTGFLTGQGRALGDLYLNVENETIVDSVLNKSVARNQSSPITLHLAAYTFSMAQLDVPVAGLNSELFDSINVLPYSFGQEQTNGSVALNPTDPGYLAPDSTSTLITGPSRIRVFPGRDTSVPIYLNDAMFTINAATSTVGFSQDLFNTINEPTSTVPGVDPAVIGKVPGYLSDMVQFNLSGLPTASIPVLVGSGNRATHLYVSGDRYAISDDSSTAQSGNFEELTADPLNPIEGLMGQPNSVVSTQFQFGSFPGTYQLAEGNPNNLTTSTGKSITSLFGRWRKVTDLVTLSNSAFDIIVFPNSNDAFSSNTPADAIAIAHNGTTITNLYIGYAYFTSTSGQPKAQLFPINSFIAGAVSGEVDYTLSGFTNASGSLLTSPPDEPSVRGGTFTLSAGTQPTGFTNSGNFVVFR